MAIFTFEARTITRGTVSVEADTIEEARAIRAKLIEHDCGQFNMEHGGGELQIDATGKLDADPGDGTHMWNTPIENAIENAQALKEAEEAEEEAE